MDATVPRRRFLQSAAALLTFPAPGAEPPDPSWLWSGAITATSATVRCGFTALPGERPGAPPPFLLGEERDLRDARAVEGTIIPAPSATYPHRVVVDYALTGLKPDREYFGGYRPASGTRVRFRTFGAGAFSFTAAFASCAGGTRMVPLSHVSNSEVFAAIQELDPHVFIHMGDLHYYNLTGAARPIEPLTGQFRRALDRVLSQEHQALFYRQTPIVYMWDDHDFGPNDADGTSPSRDAVRAFYATDVPHYALPLSPNADGPICQTFDVGRVRFLTTDSRSERLPSRKTLLGQRQFAWMIDELGRAAQDKVPLVVWVNPVPWITRDDDVEGWGSYAAERKALGERITALGLGPRLLMMSGDAHWLAFDDGRNNAHGGFVVAQAAPLDRFIQKKGGPYSHEPPQQRNGQFAMLQVEDTGAEITATVQGYRHLGNGRAIPVPEARLRLRCGGAQCAVVGTTTNAGV